ncbi:MAG TPA: hypothetical protein VNN13_09800 [Methylomirabilota bacterium]|nr:hypothetical protein [Methylomirabilota bacterium]
MLEAMRASKPPPAFRPADVCRALLAALQAAEGRRKKRKRDQTPDAIGLALKREILERVVEDDPEPEMFEGWLLEYADQNAGRHSRGGGAAMARAVLDEWNLAHSMGDFKAWLDRGAPSDDADSAPQFRGGEAAKAQLSGEVENGRR